MTKCSTQTLLSGLTPIVGGGGTSGSAVVLKLQQTRALRQRLLQPAVTQAGSRHQPVEFSNKHGSATNTAPRSRLCITCVAITVITHCAPPRRRPAASNASRRRRRGASGRHVRRVGSSSHCGHDRGCWRLGTTCGHGRRRLRCLDGRVVRFVAPHIVIVCIVSKTRDLCILIVFSPLLIV